MEKYLQKRNSLKATLTRIEQYVKTHLDVSFLDDLEVRREVFVDTYKQYLEIQDKIEEKKDSEESDRIDVETIYFSTLIAIKTLQATSNRLNSNNASSNQTFETKSIKLPHVQIPTFSGQVEDWIPFVDLFISLIDHNNSLTDVQRFYYLKGFLKDEPLNLINNLRLTSENYEVAWDILRKRYDNEFIIINAHVTAILNAPIITKGNAHNLREFLTNIRQHLNSLRALKLPVDKWDVILVCILTKKLDYQTHKAYELEKSKAELPTITDFLNILERHCIALETVSVPAANQTNSNKPKLQRSFINSSNNKSEAKKCEFCSNKNHSIYRCFKFKNLTPSEKDDYIRKNSMCYNCLQKGHTLSQCRSGGCRLCNKRHHTQLHKPEQKPVDVTQSNQATAQVTNYAMSSTQGDSQTRPSSADNATTLLIQNNDSSQILLATAQVNIVASNGNLICARALLDCGSQTSFITTKTFKRLNLRSYHQNIQILGLSSSPVNVNKMVDITIQSRTTNYSAKLSCAILENITSDLPHCVVNTNIYKIPPQFLLADPEYHTPASIDLLIGADLFFDLMLADTKLLGFHLPILQNTKLGYIVSGQAPTTYSHHVRRALCSTSTNNVDDTISRFWQLEEVISQRILGPQERLCEKSFVQNTVLANGQYTVRLPFLNETARSLLGGSFNTTLRRFYSLERRLMKDQQLYTDYKKFIHEYIDLGHAKYNDLDLSLLKNNNSDGYFLPHHPVIKESSRTTKLRVVFDASSRTTSGYSLNDILLTGATIQPELFDIICRYRTHRYVLTADIEKMYRGVRVAEQDTNLQRILWRDNVNDPLRCITLTTVTYGTSAAPFLATRCLVKLANDEAANYPLAAAALLADTYIDDILSGSDTLTGISDLKVQLINLLALAGFKLHKWFSNQPSIISDVTSVSMNDINVNITDNELSVKTLGLSWSPTSDHFRFSSPQDSSLTECTKRNVLSFIGKIFDPLGLLGPIVVLGKLLLQQIWSRKLNWDDALPPDILKEWQKFENNILQMNDISIPRWLFTNSLVVAIEMHAFSDASQRAYGAAAYFRVLYSDKTVSTRLVCAKSRVAPLKTITLPRLELCGALLMARMIHRVINIFNINFSNTYLWTDSSIVLHWLNSSPSRWNTFVANRVSEIQELTHNFHWLHVKTTDNPSDFLSRGTDPTFLQASTIWWEGPEWLNSYEARFIQRKSFNLEHAVPEQRKVMSHLSIEIDQDFTRFSKFSRLLRAVAYCFRFAHNSQPKNTKISGSLTAKEINHAHDAVIRIVQHQIFGNEIILLTRKLELTKSVIKMLNPFLDQNGLLRVSSRLSNADITFDQKYPLILPQGHHVTNLIITHTHFVLLHAGPQAVLSHLRLRYWPLNGKRQVKKLINKCVTCFRHKAITSEQLMGALPADRVQNARPFSKVGVDFGGPFLLRQSRLKKAVTTKSYMALFVCMVTKAIHIELVSNMTTEAFLLALKRFISRRGKPTVAYSDNGLNFVGANNHLRELHHLLVNETHISRVQDATATQGITWKFIPPHSPNWGGLWEAGIKSAKFHVKRVVGNLVLTYEELATVFSQIEAILNSRPLCQLSNDPNDLSYLTPGHFLIQAPLTAYPERDLSTTPMNRLSFWQQCTQLQQLFWKRWHVEYLNQLQNRPKWLKERPNINENSLVLLKEDNIPPLQWHLARVVRIIPGRDGRVRVAEIKTQTGTYLRPIIKLCVLPLE